MTLEDEIKQVKNITKINGKYLFVNHKAGVATEGYDTPIDLCFNMHRMRFDLHSVSLMRSRYEDLYPVHRFEGSDCGKKIINDIVANESLLGSLLGARPLNDKKVTRRDLEFEYWGSLYEMVARYNAEHNCDVKPWECVKHIVTKFEDHPKFLGEPEHYQIAVAIVYDERVGLHKPVFLGDPIYSKSGGTFDWNDPDYLRQITHPVNCWTWTPPKPKREFEINGEKFTCPEKERGALLRPLHFCGEIFYFEKAKDRDRVRGAIRKLLRGARDK